jgi:hypothetical protein
MSADTGIYIAQFPDGYRVTEVVQAIENVFYYEPGTEDYKSMVASYFGKSPVFECIKNAEAYAFEVYHKYEEDERDSDFYCLIEYGISHLGKLAAFK